jgi:nitroimidazol reductase NimA-like FMN-containing flavoprotein (pyridoxamine 5'-phosphate oxidase superfamily)
MSSIAPTPRTQVRRLPKRGVYDTEQIYAILNEGFLCHVGFVQDQQPFVIPTLFVRCGDTLYLHGSAASRMLKTAGEGVDICVTVTLLDGFVLARSVFHHSMNYRSVVVLGKARLVTEIEEKSRALHAFTDKIARDRWGEARTPTEQEYKATNVLAIPIQEASAKVRTGPPLDDEEDYSLALWAGVVPVRMSVGIPQSDGRVLEGVAPFDTGRLCTERKPGRV